jgi:hypothetical protein
MSQHLQKFDSLMYQYCSEQAERAYKLFEDGETENGMLFLAHLADVLVALKDNRDTQDRPNITGFAGDVMEFNELDKDAVFTHFQENGYGQYIPE